MTKIGITMGCPAGIGPELILKYFADRKLTPGFQTVVLGDSNVLKKCSKDLGLSHPQIISHQIESPLPDNSIPVIELSSLDNEDVTWGTPNPKTGKAMGTYIETGARYALEGLLDGIATCPISKTTLNDAGYNFPGHTEMLGSLTNSDQFVMMMAGTRLRVTLVTIHCGLRNACDMISRDGVYSLIVATNNSLQYDFGIVEPKIGVAGLNPHAGEDKLFGEEEITIIGPAVETARKEGINATGPFPPDTVFHKAASGSFDAVVCMYHDQGLIPFKLLHFEDGVNVTLGLPIVRTSVDHGTAYDIAGKGIATHTSLAAAVTLAAFISDNRQRALHR